MVMDVSYVANLAKSEDGVEKIANVLMRQVSKSELSSFIKRLSFYIEHINILNKSIQNGSYNSQITVLNSLKNKLQEDSQIRSLSVNSVAKSYQENI